MPSKMDLRHSVRRINATFLMALERKRQYGVIRKITPLIASHRVAIKYSRLMGECQVFDFDPDTYVIKPETERLVNYAAGYPELETK